MLGDGGGRVVMMMTAVEEWLSGHTEIKLLFLHRFFFFSLSNILIQVAKMLLLSFFSSDSELNTYTVELHAERFIPNPLGPL